MFTWCVNWALGVWRRGKPPQETWCSSFEGEQRPGTKLSQERGEGNKDFQPVVTGRCQCGHLQTGHWKRGTQSQAVTPRLNMNKDKNVTTSTFNSGEVQSGVLQSLCGWSLLGNGVSPVSYGTIKYRSWKGFSQGNFCLKDFYKVIAHFQKQTLDLWGQYLALRDVHELE